MKEHYNKVLRDSDARVARFMEIQILDRNDPFFGGFPSADSIAEPKVAIYHLTTMTACCLNADSKWHLDAEVLRRILLALDYVRRSQRPGGYFDLVNCNFFSGLGNFRKLFFGKPRRTEYQRYLTFHRKIDHTVYRLRHGKVYNDIRCHGTVLHIRKYRITVVHIVINVNSSYNFHFRIFLRQADRKSVV